MTEQRILPDELPPLCINVRKAADMLGLGINKVYELMDTDGLPRVRFGKAVRVPVKALEQWLEEYRQRHC